MTKRRHAGGRPLKCRRCLTGTTTFGKATKRRRAGGGPRHYPALPDRHDDIW
jgi:hypothetical protein